MLIKCPECCKEISDKAKTCPHCGYPTKNTVCLINSIPIDLLDIMMAVENNGITIEIIKMIREKTSLTLKESQNLCNKIYIEKCIPFEFNGETQKVNYQSNNQPHCPKCGCANFTPIRKKFSLIAGFATNKIELVCNNCGTKIHPK